MRWVSFLEQSVSAAAAGAVGGAATAALANPVAGAAAGEAAMKAAEELLAEFLPAQQEALDTLVERTGRIEALLGNVASDVRTLLDAPWQTALLHLADASRHPANAGQALGLARQYLYEAWASATASAKRALIAQQLAAVYALLGRDEDSREWLFRSYPEASAALRDAAASIVESFDGLPRVKVKLYDPYLGKHNDPRLGALPEGVVAIFGNDQVHPLKYVPEEPLLSSLTDVAQAKVDLVALRLACAIADMPEPWPNEQDRADDNRNYWVVRGPNRSDYRPIITLLPFRFPDAIGGYIVWGTGEAAWRPVELLASLGRWSFGLPRSMPSFPSGTFPPQMFVSGSCPELGRWGEERAIPLGVYGIELEVLDSGQDIEWKYFARAAPGEAAVWESGPNRRLQPPSGRRQLPSSRVQWSHPYSALDRKPERVAHSKTWRSPETEGPPGACQAR